MSTEREEVRTDDQERTHYDRHYRSGGFRYAGRREFHVNWVKTHYVDAFGMKPGMHVLDLPCGDGFWSSILTELGMTVTGIDFSPGGIAEAQRLYPGIPFLVGNAEEPIAGNEVWDVVFSRAITHLHWKNLFTERSAVVAKNLMAKVKPDGVLLVSYYTQRDGKGTEAHAYHPISDLVRLFEPVGDIAKVELIGDMVQIGVMHSARLRASQVSRREWPTALALPKLDGQSMLQFPCKIVAAGKKTTITAHLAEEPAFKGRKVTPVRLWVPPQFATSMEVRNITLINRKDEIPLFTGSHIFPAEQFNGIPSAEVPYGLLPRVSVDVDTDITIQVKNAGKANAAFTAVLLVDIDKQ